MSAPLLEKLKSILVYEESDLAPTAASPRQITVDNSSINTIGSADFAATSNDEFVLNVLEALDGNVKGQLVLIKSINATTDVATTTNFREAPSGLTSCKVWNFNIKGAAVATSAGTTEGQITSTRLTQADDYWNGYKVIGLDTANNYLTMANVTDFAVIGDLLTTSFASNSDIGDAYIICQPIQPQGVEISVSGGTVIERDIVTDNLSQEGIIVGTQDEVSINISPEIRGLSNTAGDNETAEPPIEVRPLVQAIMTEGLGTGGVVDTPTNAVYFTADNASIGQYCLGMVNGDVFAKSTVTSALIQTYNGHISTTPVSGDIIHAGACYSPKDTGHSSVGFACMIGDSELAILSGCMPSFGLSLEGNSIARYNFNYLSSGGFWAPYSKTHDDVYDTTAPIAVKSNVSRIVIGGVELDADLMTLSAELLPEPNRKGANFGAFEGSGGYFYTMRQPTITMTIYFENSDYYHMFRAATESDLLVQVGTVPGNTFALWAPRAQIVESPTIGADGELMTQDVSFRLLRPTTAGQPDFVLGIF
jgi:hypothetical protein